MRSNINGTSFLTALRHAAVTLAAIALVTMAVATASRGAQPQGNSRLAERVRKQLVTLPYYGVFDNLAFKVQGDTVVLYGQVVRPSTRSDAEHRVARIEGVDRVINQIQVLPLSPMDASIRRRVYRAVFRQDGLYRYALGANPSIHIIVNRGHVTLEGVVANKMDSQLAYMAANGVSGVFSVTNNLRVERSS
ncbi:MAG TPA: BON domain-containing protein [Blastocatellia bacterium]|nr:BON domain-containing protein [Blastocatellia bacterium]